MLARHSGEFLELKGETAQAMPFGSTLKPFIIAAAVDRALDKDHVMSFPQRRNDPMWACGDHGVTSKMDAATALSYSCNGWFLEYERRYGSTIPSLAFGAYTELLQSLGLEHEPWDMSEAIGLRTSLTITPRGAAHAYRALFDRASASVVRALKSSGTVVRSDGVARKTGSVRDHDSTPILGWLVAVTDDLVIVRTKPGVAGAALADEVDAVIERYRGRRDLSRVDVQVFGLVAPSDVMVRCDGAIADVAYPPKYVVRPPRRGVEPAAYALHNIVTGASTLGCFGGPWRVSIEGGPERRYAGFFSFWKAPPLSEAAAKRATPKQQNARRGSDIVFTTTRARYVQGVLIAEDSSLRGEAKAALARVIDHNADASKARHGDRPVCDTTHCQTFLGTRDGYPDDDVMRAIAVPLSSTGRDGWLPFSQGGSEPWQEYRPVWEARAAVGTFSAIKMDGNTVVVVRPMVDKGNHFDVTAAMPCEVLRSHLKLPSCPSSVEVNGNAMLFRGVGRGHGLGLNVEAAKTMAKKGKSADDILDAAYPR